MKKSMLSKLNTLPYFTKEALRSISDVSENALSKNISRWMSKGYVVKLKNGLYVTEESFGANKGKKGYIELIANKLRTPSYVSLEYVLASHDILTEATYAITSVTTKATRVYENEIGKFIYKSVKEDLFIGYEAEHFNNLSYLVATKAKALFDYLYLRTDSLVGDFDEKNMVEEMRLKLDSFTKTDWDELKDYCEIASKPSTSKLVENIIKNASD
jgi:predicted transcriptional regulator of viral defense system